MVRPVTYVSGLDAAQMAGGEELGSNLLQERKPTHGDLGPARDGRRLSPAGGSGARLCGWTRPGPSLPTILAFGSVSILVGRQVSMLQLDDLLKPLPPAWAHQNVELFGSPWKIFRLFPAKHLARFAAAAT
jgi:hypothetical protein